MNEDMGASAVADPLDPSRVERALKSLTLAGRKFLAGVDAEGKYENNGGQTFGIGNGLRGRGLATGWQRECGRRGEIGLTPLGRAVRAAIAMEAGTGETACGLDGEAATARAACGIAQTPEPKSGEQ